MPTVMLRKCSKITFDGDLECTVINSKEVLNFLKCYIKQIMTGLEGNPFAPRDSGAPPQEFLLTKAQPRSIETLGEAILNLKGQIDSLLPSRPVIICLIIPLCFSKEKNDYFNWKLISSTMGLVTKKHIRLNDYMLF